MKKPEEYKDAFVAMPIKMFAYGHDMFITKKDEDAFLLYYIVDKMTKNLHTWGEVETNIVLLSKLLPMKTKETDNRKEVKRLLLSLHEKGWIKIFHDETSMEYDTLLTIRTMDLDNTMFTEVVQSDNYKHSGWVAVNEDMFKACKGNARHLRMMIYAEWRMFRGKDFEGNYSITHGEWTKVLDISKQVSIELAKEVSELNLVDKFQGQLYTDAKGQVKREPNRYAPVSVEERSERKKDNKGYGFEKQHHIDVNVGVAQLDVTDKRVEKTNIFKTGDKDYLKPYCYAVIMTTECEATKKRGLNRLELIKKASKISYDILVKEGKKEMDKMKRVESAKQSAQQSSDNATYEPSFYDNVEDNGVDYYAIAKQKKAEREAQERMNAILDEKVSVDNDEDHLPF